MALFREFSDKTIKFSNTGIYDESDYYLEAIGVTSYGGINPKIFWEFEIIIPSIRYHTDSSVIYSHCPHKFGFLVYTPPTQCRIRDGVYQNATWVEVGYDDGFGYCIKKINQNSATEDRAIFDNPNEEILINIGDTIGFEIDVTAGILNNFYINGIKQTISDSNYSIVSSWTPIYNIRPYVCLYNAPYVSESSALSDASPQQEFCAVRYNNASGDFRYGPSAGYSPITFGIPYSETRPAVPNNRKYTISDTATITPTITIPTGSVIWTTIKWEDSSASPSFTKRGELILDISSSAPLSDYQVFDEKGFVLWATNWVDLDKYSTNIPIQILNDKIYYLLIGVEMYSGDLDYARVWTGQGAFGGGTYIIDISVNPV
jgi:hypothetical protein